MSVISSIVPKSRFRRIPKGGAFDATRFNATVEELVQEVQELQAFHNDTLVPLLVALPRGIDDDEFPATAPDAVEDGLSGSRLWTDDLATSDSGDLFWDLAGGRKVTIKETALVLQAAIDSNYATLQSLINSLGTGVSAYTRGYIGLHAFDSGLASSVLSMDGRITTSQANINQLRLDAFSGSYSLDGDGQANLTYSLLQLTEALLSLHGGGTYLTGYPYSTSVDLTHDVYTSDLLLDSRIPQDYVDNSTGYIELNRAAPVASLEDNLNRLRYEIHVLRGSTAWDNDVGVAPAYDPTVVSLAAHIDDLGTGVAAASNPHGLAIADITNWAAWNAAVKTFTGMDADSDSTPDYSAYGAIVNISDGDSLEETCWKLDAAIEALDLQDIYDQSATGVILLDNGIGVLSLKDSVGGLGTNLFQVTNNAGATVYFGVGGAQIHAGIPICMPEQGADPGAVANQGFIYTKDDAGDTELYYRDAVGAVVAVTRDGRVLEKEVGCFWVSPTLWATFAAPAGPKLAYHESAGPPAIAWLSLDFDGTGSETAYATIGVPVDEVGLTPSKIRVTMNLLQVAVAGPVKTRWEFSLSDPGAGNYGVISDENTFLSAWSAVTGVTVTDMHQNELQVVEVGTFTLNPTGPGVINIRLARDPAHADDTLDGQDAGILGIMVTYLR